MKINITEYGEFELKEVYSNILLTSDDKEEFSICMRDSGFEFKYNNIWYEAKNGTLKPL
jgi:hypothetical protein